MTTGAPTTRLAPSPTGALHLGNARTFLVNWALARRHGWRIVLRIEDLDGPRVKPEAIAGTIRILEWLGIDWDVGPLIQSADLDSAPPPTLQQTDAPPGSANPYAAAMDRLARAAMAYPCELTRSQIEAAASAPQEGAHDTPFPASLRPPLLARPFDDPAGSWRFATPDLEVLFNDLFAGPQRFRPSATVGDFVIWTKRAQPSYQLAVVVDDARQHITHVVRGDDLLDSAARQLLLYRALGLPNEPCYIHLPLVRGQDGRRLAKRHGDTRIDTYRNLGVPVEHVIGLVASWCGITAADNRQNLTATEFAAALDLSKISPHPVTFTNADDAWLRRRRAGG